MEQDKLNEVLQRNVAKLSKLSERERDMMPAGTAPMPSVEEVRRIVSLCKDIIFTDYFHKRQSDEKMRSYHIGVSMDELYNLLKRQIARGMQFCEDCNCSEEEILKASETLALKFIDQLPEVKRLLYTDVEAMFQSDPAATNYGHQMQVPVIPRIITEQAHSKTGIDIHPGAQIGEYFAIDHGTGVVIGETTIIGSHVTLYQGVTLGAKSFRYDENGNMLNIPRHPIIEDHVTVYSNASILGRITIGHHSVIGGNIWVTNDVPPYSRIQQSKAIEASFQGGLGI